jgi:hypothetical protein
LKGAVFWPGGLHITGTEANSSTQKKEEFTMRAITLTALFIAAMAMSNISSAASMHEASLTSTQMAMHLVIEDQDEDLPEYAFV